MPQKNEKKGVELREDADFTNKKLRLANLQQKQDGDFTQTKTHV